MRKFEHIHVDVVGPLPASGSSRYLLTIVDHSIRWLEATPISKATTHACAEALLLSWISHFGVPNDITTNRGSAFSLAILMGTTLHSTRAYNPAANHLVERAHRILKAALIGGCTDEHWKAQLPWVLLGLHNAPKADSEPFPAEKLDHLRDIAGIFRPCLKIYEDRTRHFTPKNLDDCEYFFIQVNANRQPLTRS
ncbi:uncharacterized protein [Palaemon carinicauda]|uniref:uncharacterized protein n=1 Tax=Palaemon carinicauda TaxID=392227 RepID=UPI0035B5B667